jgi:hypothetical protein
MILIRDANLQKQGFILLPYWLLGIDYWLLVIRIDRFTNN